eukprot:scaffold97603_cov33-Tisochrysis_lutea.AAC.2
MVCTCCATLTTPCAPEPSRPISEPSTRYWPAGKAQAAQGQHFAQVAAGRDHWPERGQLNGVVSYVSLGFSLCPVQFPSLP